MFPEGSGEWNPPEDAFGFNAKGGGDAAAAEKGGGKKPAPKKSAKVKLPGTYVVRGIVTSYKSGKLVVAAGKGGVAKGEVDDDATINVDVADFSCAVKGDTIRVEGHAAQANMIQAESVTITAKEPLTGPTKKKPAHVDKKKKKDASGDDADDAKPEKKAAPTKRVRLNKRTPRAFAVAFPVDEHGAAAQDQIYFPL